MGCSAAVLIARASVFLAALSWCAAPPASALARDDACSTPPEQEVRERAKPPRKKRGMPDLSPEELRRWGPIRVEAVIDCEGELVRIEILDEVPSGIAEKIEANLAGWRFRPATIDGEPIAMPFRLVLQLDPPRRSS